MGAAWAPNRTRLLLLSTALACPWSSHLAWPLRYGEAFEEVKARTSTLPFKAILEGRQQLPNDYYKASHGGPCIGHAVALKPPAKQRGNAASVASGMHTAPGDRATHTRTRTRTRKHTHALTRAHAHTHRNTHTRTHSIATALATRRPLQEFMRGPYFALIPFCVGAYLCHPLMQRAAYFLGW